MAAFRSPPQFNGGLRKWYRRFNASAKESCDLCWKRSLNFRLFSRVQVINIQRDEEVTKPSALNNHGFPKATEKQQCSKVKGLYLSHNLENCTVDLARPTQLHVFGTHITKTSVLVIPFNSLQRTACSSKLNHKPFRCLRHYFTDEFKGQRDETEEVMEVKGHSGSADSGSPNSNEIDEFKGHKEEAGEVMEVKGHSGSADSGSFDISDVVVVDEIGELAGVRNDQKPSDIYEDGTSAKDGQLISSSHPIPPIKVDSYNLAPFVAKSDVLRFLLHLKVNLAKIESKPNVANSLVKLNMEQDVVPTMLFLKDAGIPDAKLGKVIGIHPYIFEEIDKAKLVVEFLQLKKFKKETIAHMIVGAPPILGLKVLTIDERIGTYQKFFNLTGDQARDVMARVPRLLLNRPNELKETIEVFRGYEFSDQQLKKILLKCPSVFKRPKETNLEHRLEYLLTDIPMDQNTIAEFGYILLYPSNPIKERHQFLLELGRAQYDPTKESYISPTDLVCTPELKFCKLARTTPAVFKAFKKTL
ncbi:transcription termination factor 3, mitochondrial-like [Mizuhopecten yessoensis]|uniref:mTERF domain-containing protein 1, mitochondrial n=1 Tax=Mizuhopecten yessoensis TaxID=6573 RepID=A0A210PEN1_MIZYE|nr:transcription termination factor 3, mitochondrial-like [Mizuhopecten yessoensis]XP_021343462.1 transcription termination factor 3, mitochondrial-like [Mizuhopecten yessoensis]OWF34948.1 mTERF domain-containing protein 1, mitochondrial [Mizuhopecten yessoensis]